MGLAGNKNRTKLSHDPNNTNWSKSTDGFGHKILSKQGWKPGDYLGAENAAHGDHYTSANASHIRVLLREDNLGLGAKVGGKGNAETFGLSTLSGIFGRLNGKSDVEVEKKQSLLRDAELRSWQAQKYGFMNFVKGGLLVGDKIEEAGGKMPDANTVDAKSADAGTNNKVRKKRKADSDEPERTEQERSQKKSRKSGPATGTEAQPVADTGAPVEIVSKKKRTATKEKSHDQLESAGDGPAPAVVAQETGAASTIDEDRDAKKRQKEVRRADRASRKAADVDADTTDAKSLSKQERRARKEERRKRKEEKRAKKHRKPQDSGIVDEDSSEGASGTTGTSALPTPSASELPSGVSTPTLDSPGFKGRNVLRQRYIQQKRMASMDPRALNEILMIKAQS